MSETTTPKAITLAILQFCERFDAAILPPIYLPVRPVPSEKFEDCFNIVRRQVEREGGNILHGWIIWEWPHTAVEGEFHAVWVSPGGEQIDISPKRDGETSVLFLPAPQQVFTGERLPNERIPLRDHPLIHEFIQLAKERAKFVPPAGKTMTIDARPLVRIERRIAEIIPHLKRMADCRRRSGRRK